jgi:DNA end-binding protein Ku
VPRRKSQPAEAKSEAPRAEPQQPAPNPEASAVRGFWSGSLSFGLVSIPVNLITAQRTSRVALRMLGPDGTPLKRRFFCSKHDQALDSADIVRGYEVEKERFVVVTDDELKALAPKLSQEIDLTRFVPLEDIDPMHFEHGYFLVPNKKSGKAYRLLARIMEDRKRAGIATFVMRGKQYLVAIIASGGVLRAETLRFADELRSTDEIGVASSANASTAAIDAFERQIDTLRADALAPDELDDTQTQRLLELIDRKRSKGTDVIAASDVRFEDSSGAQIVDLLQYLKDSIAGGTKSATPAERKRPRSAARDAEPAEKRPPAKKRASRGGG